MDITYLSLIIFIVITYIYYAIPAIGKINFTLDALKNKTLGETIKKNYSRFGIYLMAIVVTQFAINSLYLVNKCGGDSGQNVGAAAFLTFFPWVFIFGIMCIVLMMYPYFKSAFSDVVGYFAIASKANKLLTSILVDVDAEEAVDKTNLSDEDKKSMKRAADALLKLCGNKSIIINKMTPFNFIDVWNMLVPLMKNSGNIPDLPNIQDQLYNLVILKDNIGEAVWYIYTAILVTSLISYNLSTKPCKKSLEQIKADHDKYLEDEKKMEEQKALNNSTPMVISG
jgi:hypothetical protein